MENCKYCHDPEVRDPANRVAGVVFNESSDDEASRTVAVPLQTPVEAIHATLQAVTITCNPFTPSEVSREVPASATERVRFCPSSVPLF